MIECSQLDWIEFFGGLDWMRKKDGFDDGDGSLGYFRSHTFLEFPV